MRIRPAQQSLRGSAKDTEGYDLVARLRFVCDAHLFAGFRCGDRLAVTAR